MHIELKWSVPSKKNAQVSVVVKGKIRRIYKPEIAQKILVIKSKLIVANRKEPLIPTVKPNFIFYLVNYKNVADLDNQVTTMLDCMTETKIIEDDRPRCIRGCNYDSVIADKWGVDISFI